MSIFFDEPRKAAGFYVLIFFINVFNKPHKGLRRGDIAERMEQWAKRQYTLYTVFSINAMPYAIRAML
jgi:hypothetical protein